MGLQRLNITSGLGRPWGLFPAWRLPSHFERFRLELPILFQQDFHFAFRFFQFFAAGPGKLHSFLEERQRLFQGDITLFQFPHNLLQTLEAVLKFRQRDPLLKDILVHFDHRRYKKNFAMYF